LLVVWWGSTMGQRSAVHSRRSIAGSEDVGGLVGATFDAGTVSDSFWDVEASGMEVSAAGTGKTTAEMMSIATFAAAMWDITAVAFGETDGGYTWNIVDGESYPFLRWWVETDMQEIRTWHDLDAMRNNLAGRYVLVNDLDSTTPGYEELASATANGGKGWEPIATGFAGFTGTFDGQGHEIRDLFVGRPVEVSGGLFGGVDASGVIKNVGVVNADVTGGQHVGGLVADNRGGTVDNSYFTGSVSGRGVVGGLVGATIGGTVINSYSVADVSGERSVGGLVGGGWGGGTVTNSHYDYDEVVINGENTITTGALFGEDFAEWLDNDKYLDVNERLSQENGYYLIHDVNDLKQLLAFGQDDSLKFRLQNNLDLVDDPGLYIPYFAGEFDGNGCTISNLSLHLGLVAQVGLFGYLASSGTVSDLGVEDIDVTGSQFVGGLVAKNWHGTVNNCYSTGSVTGHADALSPWAVGGLVGWNEKGAVRSSYSAATVSGESVVGGLVGWNYGTICNSYSTGDVTGSGSVGGLVGLNDRPVTNSYSIGSVTGSGNVGGLVGNNRYGAVGNSFWDVETSGMEESDGGTGKGTTGMMSITTFTDTATARLDEPWNIVTVAPDETNPAYIWNIVDGQSYPFLSWETGA